MSSENDSSPAGLYGLDPSSYTAQRLQHASPEHVNLTTRSCFIGPIPEGWLKSHRKQWYKHHLHVNYHSRAATFSGNNAVSRLRRLSGLDGPSAAAMYGHSFPQPGDADDDDDEDDDTGDCDTGEEGEAALDVQVPRARNIPLGADADGDGKAANADGDGPATDASSPTGRRRSSFDTAHECVGGTDGQSDAQRSKSRDKCQQGSATSAAGRSGAKNPNLAVVTEDAERRSSSLASSSWTGPEASNSNASLLPRGAGSKTDTAAGTSGNKDGKPSSSAAPGGAKDDAREDPTGFDGAAEASTDASIVPKAHPAAPALVRFNLPDGAAEGEQRTRARLARISRRRSLRRSRPLGKRNGEIVKLEKMLVKVESSVQDLPEEYDENESMSIDTQMVKKWQEYVAVCREFDNQDADFILQLYRTRVIPARQKSEARKTSAYEIPLNPKNTRVNLYSTLDKTVVIWVPWKKQTQIFILRPRSFASSVEWYTFLRNSLGWSRPRELQVKVPDLSVSLMLDNPFKELETQRDAAQQQQNIDDATLLKTMQAEQAVAGNIIRRCMEMLESNLEWARLLQKWPAAKRMGLAWKHYDRLEWVHGAHEQKMYGTVAMARSHDLELRPKHHYPTSAPLGAARRAISIVGADNSMRGPTAVQGPACERPQLNVGTVIHNGECMTEPPPVEGFLIRLTSQRGRARLWGRMFYKRLYFSTHDQFLCFSTPAKAIPPPPPRLPLTRNAAVPSVHQIREKLPLIYAIEPYPLADTSTGDGSNNGNGNGDGNSNNKSSGGGSGSSRIAWLSDDVPLSERQLRDQDAFDEAERRVNTLLRADGYVDMCKVRVVRTVVRGTVPADRVVHEGDEADFDADVADTERDDGAVDSFDDSRTFELVLQNGLVVRLEAYDAVTRDEWVRRLRALVAYWALRKAADVELLRQVRRANLQRLQIDELSEAYVGQFAEKWEASRALASPELYHMCAVSCCRTISMSGHLYWKPRRRATFRRCSVLLCHGQLLLFETALRGRTGAEIAYSHQGRAGAAVALADDCYVYSGLAAADELLYQSQSAAGAAATAATAGTAAATSANALPRVYLEDGWRSAEEDTMTTFVVWRAARRQYFRAPAADAAADVAADAVDGSGGDSSGGGRGGSDAGEGGISKLLPRLRHVTTLGVPGRAMVFKARSRSERDRWVVSIATEIERLHQPEDIRLVA